MAFRTTKGMRDYWNHAAETNAAWYVDTSLSFADPDMEKFFETGKRIVAEAMDGAPVTPARHDHAIEIGSGLGRICLALSDRFARVTGVDIAPEMVKRANELVHDPRIEFKLTDGASIPGVADGDADFVLTFTVFQHIPDVRVIAAYIAEAGRVLGPGGVFVFQWNNTPGVVRWRVRRAVLSALHRTGIRRETHGRDVAQFLGSVVPVAQMRRYLERAGLELVEVRGEGELFCFGWARKPA
ncbi:MAG: class I SAM-dependent methyltransferase [Actinomycetes bacterium]